MTFDLCIGIDYSGAGTSQAGSASLQVYAAADGVPERVLPLAEEAKPPCDWSSARISICATAARPGH